jgi:hypothetical protein
MTELTHMNVRSQSRATRTCFSWNALAEQDDLRVTLSDTVVVRASEITAKFENQMIRIFKGLNWLSLFRNVPHLKQSREPFHFMVDRLNVLM